MSDKCLLTARRTWKQANVDSHTGSQEEHPVLLLLQPDILKPGIWMHQFKAHIWVFILWKAGYLYTDQSEPAVRYSR